MLFPFPKVVLRFKTFTLPALPPVSTLPLPTHTPLIFLFLRARHAPAIVKVAILWKAEARNCGSAITGFVYFLTGSRMALCVVAHAL